MEVLVGLLALGLLVGLLFRNKGDNTMDTLSKGCGYIIALVFLLFVLVVIATFLGFKM